jgi:hypothetical protein
MLLVLRTLLDFLCSAMRNQIEFASLFVVGNNEHEHDLWAKAFFPLFLVSLA